MGSESTCVLVLEATVRLLPDPPHHALLVVGYPDAAAAADHVPELSTAGLIGLECFDAGVLDNLAKHGEHIPGMDELPEGGGWLLAEYGADTPEEANDLVATAVAGTGPASAKLVEDRAGQAEVWEVRRSTIEYTRIPGEHSGSPAGRTPRCRRSGSATTSATTARWWADTATTPCCSATSARAACTTGWT